MPVAAVHTRQGPGLSTARLVAPPSRRPHRARRRVRLRVPRGDPAGQQDRAWPMDRLLGQWTGSLTGSFDLFDRLLSQPAAWARSSCWTWPARAGHGAYPGPPRGPSEEPLRGGERSLPRGERSLPRGERASWRHPAVGPCLGTRGERGPWGAGCGPGTVVLVW